MGTRGFFGFYYKGKYYLVYNHYDSYPQWLGKTIVKELKAAIDNNRLDEWKSKLDNIKVVTDKTPPTSEEIELLKKYSNTSVSRQTAYDWYCLLHKCQGSLEDVLESGYLYSLGNTPQECWSSWTEYGYVVNLDSDTLDYYSDPSTHVPTSYKYDTLPDWS